ncbi:MAG: DNA repair protein RecN, partial [Bacillota bacterium]
MLVELHIRDFAVIDRLHIAFRPGFNVLTGETGAGKSIVVDALQTVLGGRARSDLVRAGRDAALVEAVFELADDAPVKAVLEEMHVLDAEDPNTLVLRRDVFSNGRSRCRINGHLVTVAQLAAVGAHLVDLHGQHDPQSLSPPPHPAAPPDALGGA